MQKMPSAQPEGLSPPPLRAVGHGTETRPATMQLGLLLCLMLLSPQAATFRRHRSREVKKRVKESPLVATVSPCSRDFTFDLYRALAAAAPDQNIFFSPLSISITLAVLSLGAQANTKAQILEGLGLTQQGRPAEELHEAFQQLLCELGQPREDMQLSLGNALFVGLTVPIREAFLSAMRTLYLADTFPTNFGDPAGAQRQINDYVAKETKGKIVDLVKDLDSTEIMVMVNYIFFKAKWKKGFDHKNTREEDFYVTPEMVVRVPMMVSENRYHYLLDGNLSCKVVGLPYQGNASALLILPSEDGMAQVESGLNENLLRKWLKLLTKRQLELYLPKFSIEGSYQLHKVLPKLGIRDVFTSHADLTGITNHSNIHVSQVTHKAMMTLDEQGLEAAATTSIRLTPKGSPNLDPTAPPGTEFNRPFLGKRKWLVMPQWHYPKSKTHRRKYDVFDYVEFQYSTQQSSKYYSRWKDLLEYSFLWGWKGNQHGECELTQEPQISSQGPEWPTGSPGISPSGSKMAASVPHLTASGEERSSLPLSAEHPSGQRWQEKPKRNAKKDMIPAFQEVEETLKRTVVLVEDLKLHLPHLQFQGKDHVSCQTKAWKLGNLNFSDGAAGVCAL
ncbi:Plasma serine protease inhibitor [Manis javanica]|nr:Plasma serine protease inhibitor [Manis javanica]